MVFAFEPAHRTYAVLRDNVRGLANVRLEQLAVYSATATLPIYDFGQAFSGLNSLAPHPRVPPDQAMRLHSTPIEVRAIRLDDYFAGAAVQPSFVKIDVESMEIHVLRGMERILTSARPTVSVEVGGYDVSGAGESETCVRFLLDRGYRCYEPREGRLEIVRERTTFADGNLIFLPD
jgi:FkbM family methyltransferase